MNRLFAYNRSVDEYNQNALTQLPTEKMQKYIAVDSGISFLSDLSCDMLLMNRRPATCTTIAKELPSTTDFGIANWCSGDVAEEFGCPARIGEW